MARKAAPTPAERMRRHREAYVLSLQLGITPRDAEQELDRRAAQARDQAAQRRLDQRINAPLRAETAPDPPPPLWWNRD